MRLLVAEPSARPCEEISYLPIYLVRLADVCGVDLPEAVARKMESSEARYPSDQVLGLAPEKGWPGSL